MSQPLLTSEVPLRRFHRNMPEKELDLLKLSARRMALASARAPAIVRREFWNIDAFRAVLYDVPDDLFSDPASPHFTLTVHASNGPTVCNGGCCNPRVEGSLHPLRHWHRADVPPLADQIHYGPVVISLLNGIQIQAGDFTPSQPTTEEQTQNRPVPFSFDARDIGSRKDGPALFRREPVPQPHPQSLRTFHPLDAGGEFWTEQAGIGCFVCQAPHGSQPQVDRRCRKASGLQLDPVSQYHRLAEGQPRLGAVPVDEVVDGMRIGLVEAVEPSVFSTVRFAWSRSLRRRTFCAARIVFDLHRIFGFSFRRAASTAVGRDLC